LPIPNCMKVLATAEVRAHIRDHGGMLFVWVKTHKPMRGALNFLRTSTEPPPDALDWQRVESKGCLIFLPPGLRLPRELHLVVKGLLSRRVEAFWEGCAYII
jgi:hypothetical protein